MPLKYEPSYLRVEMDEEGQSEESSIEDALVIEKYATTGSDALPGQDSLPA